MGYPSFEQMFLRATSFKPFPYQTRAAAAGHQACRLSVPTGLGKTAAAVLSWVWRRTWAEDEIRTTTPRRLVYCLPMRVLVEQTRDCAVEWLRRLDLLAENAPAVHPEEKIAVHILMGGDREIDWDRWPDRDQILIGTQDMLLSRALNRGYAMSRFRWPMHFALLNNDCMWVMDEVQLMGNGLATTAQLQAFRRKLGTADNVCSVWMSATMRSQWLETVDFDIESDAEGHLELSDGDRDHPEVASRFSAFKPLEKAEFDASTDCGQEADLVIKNHAPRSRTLVVVNTVKRAQALFMRLGRENPPAELVLLHSRFRQKERDEAIARLLADPGEHGTIAVSTQVVEAGVDVSAKLLITDLAPWSSMVQRFGRCNRRGEFCTTRGARVFWIEPPDLDDNKKLKPAPYPAEELRAAATRLTEIDNVGPASLPPVDEAMAFSHVIRRRDIVEMFDTTPDLAGADIDVSRFIREADEHNVHVFWRDFEDKTPQADEAAPHRAELCPAPLGEVRDFLKKHPAWRWDYLEKSWAEVRSPFPGLVMMLRAGDGGYRGESGWTAKSKKPVPPVQADSTPGAAYDDDHWAEGPWQSLVEHTNAVVVELERLLVALPAVDELHADSLLLAARWHDSGKAHPVFQAAMATDDQSGGDAPPWGKAPTMKRYSRPGFRHELASALAMLHHGLPDLAAYLAAAHHGKVRLSIRSLPHENAPGDHRLRFARGIWDGDALATCDLGDGVWLPETQLDLSCMELGLGPSGPSWLVRMLALRDKPDLGPFRLAYLEALLRVADWRASDSKEVGHA